MTDAALDTAIPLRSLVVCPHCWERFPPENALWIAQHPDLIGDPRLGQDELQRFLPTRFSISGAAIDLKGFECYGLACPKCHLAIPRQLFEMDSFFLSILGAPACGKSYFLAAMTWRLRTALPQQFALAFTDADPLLNYRLQQYESVQFLNPNPDALVTIEKTETHGDLYSAVMYGDQVVHYLRPFVFVVRPLEKHPCHAQAASMSRAICLYDNAGESFLPGADMATSPVTRHLALSRVIFFLFDPTQDVRFRRACAGKTRDPQMMERTALSARERPVRQEVIFVEATQRVRRYLGLPQTARHRSPLIVVVTKYDAWAALLSQAGLPEPYKLDRASGLYGVCQREIQQASEATRRLLSELSPEIVAAAENFASEVLYVPVSATGCAPEVDPHTGAQGFRPRNLNPIWVEVPLLYAMSRWMRGLVCYWKAKDANSNPQSERIRATDANQPGSTSKS